MRPPAINNRHIQPSSSSDRRPLVTRIDRQDATYSNNHPRISSSNQWPDQWSAPPIDDFPSMASDGLQSTSLDQTGLPPGVLNMVSGFGPTAGATLTSHMDVDKVSAELERLTNLKASKMKELVMKKRKSYFSKLEFKGNLSFTKKRIQQHDIKESDRYNPSSSSNSNGGKDDSSDQAKTPFGYSRKDVLLIGLGVTVLGIGLKSGLEFVGVDPLQAGNVV